MMDEHEYCRNCLKQSGCKDWRNVIHGCPEYEPHIIFGSSRLTEQEQKIVDYLETCYTGARMMDDDLYMVRLSRALAAFKANPLDPPESIFTERFIESSWKL